MYNTNIYKLNSHSLNIRKKDIFESKQIIYLEISFFKYNKIKKYIIFLLF